MRTIPTRPRFILRLFVISLFILMVWPVGLSASIVRTGESPEQGTGLGAVTTTLTIQANPDESGCLAWNGVTDVKGSDCPLGHGDITGGDESLSQTQSRTVGETGISDVDTFRIVLNANENDGEIVVVDMVLRIYSPGGTLLYTAPLDDAYRNETLTGEFSGAGAAGIAVYALDAAQRADITALGIFDNPDNRLTILATLSGTAGGAESFYYSSFTSADLAIDKTDSADPIAPNETFSYTITLDNLGPDIVETATVTDTLPAGISSATITSVTVGGVAVDLSACTTPSGSPLSFQCTLNDLPVTSEAAVIMLDVTPQTDLSDVVLTNTVTVTSSATDDDTSNNTATETTTIGEPPPPTDLALTKTADPEPVLVGEELTYTITIDNSGDEVMNVQIVDTLPADVDFVSATPSGGTGGTCGTPVGTSLSCSFATLGGGASATVTIVVTPTDIGSITNTASVSSDAPDSDPDNNTDDVTSTVIGADLSLEKSDSPDPVQVGGTLTWTITVFNAGAATATGVTVVDPVPANFVVTDASMTGGGSCTIGASVECTAASLASGESLTVTITGTPTAIGTLSNSAVVSANEFDPDSSDNMDTEETQVVAPVEDIPSLSFMGLLLLAALLGGVAFVILR